MAPIKRKGTSARPSTQSAKRPKVSSQKASRTKIPKIQLESEVDSDPIVEYDTTEHSGDNDDVTWPSDDEDGGVPVSPPSVKKSSKARDTSHLSSKQPSRTSHTASNPPRKQLGKTPKPNAKPEATG